MGLADNVSLVTTGNLTVEGELTAGAGISWELAGSSVLTRWKRL